MIWCDVLQAFCRQKHLPQPFFWSQSLTGKFIEYCAEGNKQILVFVRVYKKESQKETFKSAIYVVKVEDLDFLWAYLTGLSITLVT